MTAQFPDIVDLDGRQYTIAGISGTGLFDPAEHGLRPVGKCSACWRGYICVYRIDERALVLDTLKANVDGPAAELFGVPPGTDRDPPFDAVYHELDRKVPFTGGLLLGRSFIDELYVHMGFHPAWKYREVRELIFEDGVLVREANRSAEAAELRKAMAGRPLGPEDPASREEIADWVRRCFDRDYSL